MARLRRPVDEFFDKVTVNADEPALRENRLRLLARIRATMNQVADFSQIEGMSLPMTKWVYSFGGGAAEGRADMRNLLGGKGANLAEMSSLGLPVPPGFTITTEVCTHFYANGTDLSRRSAGAGRRGAGRGRDDDRRHASATPTNPLLVSVRSGARASMPGMMDTVLNLGLNDQTVEGLARKQRRRALRL